MKITINANLSKKSKLNHIWSFGGNTCHAPLLLRKDMLRHLKMVKKQLGFKYVRCHGTISDDMEIVVSNGEYKFNKLNDRLQAVLII